VDTTLVVSTPEGVEIKFTTAGPVVRGVAWLIDFAIRCVLYIGVLIAIAQVMPIDFNGFVAGLVSLLAFLVEWLYPTFFEVANGATPGKRIMGLRVVQDDASPLSFLPGVIRNFLRAADFLPLFYATGLVAMNSNRGFRRLGDLAAGTLVVYAQNDTLSGTGLSGSSQPAPSDLTTDDRLALVGFAERAAELSEQRRIELANRLSPVTGNVDQDAVDTLHQWANWIFSGGEQRDKPSSAPG